MDCHVFGEVRAPPFCAAQEGTQSSRSPRGAYSAAVKALRAHSPPGHVVRCPHTIYLDVLEEGAAAALVLHLQETLGALALLLRQLAEEVAHTFQSHIVTVEIEALREGRREK